MEGGSSQWIDDFNYEERLKEFWGMLSGSVFKFNVIGREPCLLTGLVSAGSRSMSVSYSVLESVILSYWMFERSVVVSSSFLTERIS